MLKKFAAVILMIVLVLSAASAAIASGSGFFSELAQSEDADERMTALAETCEKVSASLTTPEGCTVEIGEAYYEGNRVFVSYRIGAITDLIELFEGAPETETEWDKVLENWIPAEIPAYYPDVKKENEWLNGQGQRWLKAPYCNVMDGIELEDGSYADIIAGNEMRQADGSVIGWKECIVPEESGKDTLTFRLAVSHGTAVKYQDGSTFRADFGQEGREYVTFSMNRHDYSRCLQGVSSAAYPAQAEIAVGKIDLKGFIRITAPEQAASWLAWQEGEDTEGTDLIISWNLYQHGEFVSGDLYGGTSINNTDEVVFELQYPVMDDTEDLSLIPEYAQSGEHPDEAISLTAAEASR